jgi:hypothetical protein
VRFHISKESCFRGFRFGAVVGLLAIALGAGACAGGPTMATTTCRLALTSTVTVQFDLD